MIIHLVDGTYELFRHFYGLRRFTTGNDRPYGGMVGVLQRIVVRNNSRRYRRRVRCLQTRADSGMMSTCCSWHEQSLESSRTS